MLNFIQILNIVINLINFDKVYILCWVSGVAWLKKAGCQQEMNHFVRRPKKRMPIWLWQFWSRHVCYQIYNIWCMQLTCRLVGCIQCTLMFLYELCCEHFQPTGKAGFKLVYWVYINTMTLPNVIYSLNYTIKRKLSKTITRRNLLCFVRVPEYNIGLRNLLKNTVDFIDYCLNLHH